MAGILVRVLLAYCDELHISGYATSQKQKVVILPTILIPEEKFVILPLARRFRTLQVSLMRINGPASFTIVSRQQISLRK